MYSAFIVMLVKCVLLGVDKWGKWPKTLFYGQKINLKTFWYLASELHYACGEVRAIWVSLTLFDPCISWRVSLTSADPCIS